MEDIRSSSDEMIDDGDLSEDEDDEVNQDERLYVLFLTTVQASESREKIAKRKGSSPWSRRAKISKMSRKERARLKSYVCFDIFAIYSSFRGFLLPYLYSWARVLSSSVQLFSFDKAERNFRKVVAGISSPFRGFLFSTSLLLGSCPASFSIIIYIRLNVRDSREEREKRWAQIQIG